MARLIFNVRVADRRTGAERVVRVEAQDEATAAARIKHFGGMAGDVVLAEVLEDWPKPAPVLVPDPKTPTEVELGRVYAVDLVTEGALGVLLLGQSSIRVDRLQDAINKRAKQGWRFDFAVRDNRRRALILTIESVLLVFSRPMTQHEALQQ